jgi:ribosome biogenesis protein BMS1
METFEFLNILQTHGFPKVMIFTHLDQFRTAKSLRKTKSCSNIGLDGDLTIAKCFTFPRCREWKVLKNEVKQLTLFIPASQGTL